MYPATPRIEARGDAFVLPQVILLDLRYGTARASLAHTIEAVANVRLGGTRWAAGLEIGMQIRVQIRKEAVEGRAQGCDRRTRKRGASL